MIKSQANSASDLSSDNWQTNSELLLNNSRKKLIYLDSNRW